MARGRRAPEGPTKLHARAWWGVLKRTVSEFQSDNLSDWAAALTYYAVLALFPMLIVLVALLGLVGQAHTIDTLIGSLDKAGLQGVLTLGMVLLLALVSVALVLTGSLAVAVGDAIGVGKDAVDVWSVAKWPVLLVVVMTMFA